MKDFHGTIKEIKRLILLKDKATNWQIISSYNRKIDKLKKENIDPLRPELARQLPVIKKAITDCQLKGLIYFPYKNDADILESFFLSGIPSEKEIEYHVEINSIN